MGTPRNHDGEFVLMARRGGSIAKACHADTVATMLANDATEDAGIPANR